MDVTDPEELARMTFERSIEAMRLAGIPVSPTLRTQLCAHAVKVGERYFLRRGSDEKEVLVLRETNGAK